MPPRKNPYAKLYIFVFLALIAIAVIAYIGMQYGKEYVDSGGNINFIEF